METRKAIEFIYRVIESHEKTQRETSLSHLSQLWL